MTKPEETERMQIYGLAEGDLVEFEIEAPQGGRQGKQAINEKIDLRLLASPISSATSSARNVILTTTEGGVDTSADTSADVDLHEESE